MSGIPVYTESPINTVKASGVTPQTASSNPQAPSSTPNNTSATTTAVATATSSYPAANPAAAASAPTPATQRYAPMQPTPTAQVQDMGPPAPQPGAFPIPLNKSHLPPPPKAGETYNPLQNPTMSAQTYPPQMAIPPPTRAIGAHPPSSSTSTTYQPSTSYPVPISSAEYGGTRQSLEHPPGYQQNTYAADLSPEQRRASEAEAEGYSNKNSSNNEQESVWNTAKSWAQQAGEKLQAVEAEAWKKINKQ